MKSLWVLLRYGGLHSFRMEYVSTATSNSTRLLLRRVLAAFFLLIVVKRLMDLLPAVFEFAEEPQVVLFHLGITVASLFGLQSLLRRALNFDEFEFLRTTGFTNYQISVSKLAEGLSPIAMYLGFTAGPAWAYGFFTGRFELSELIHGVIATLSITLVANGVAYIGVSVGVRYLKRATVDLLGRATLMLSTLLIGLPLAITGRGLVALVGILEGTSGPFPGSGILFARWLTLSQQQPGWLGITLCLAVGAGWGSTVVVAKLRLLPVHEAHVATPSALGFIDKLGLAFPESLSPFIVKDLRIWFRDRKRWASTFLSVNMLALLLVVLFRLMALPQGAYHLGGMLIPVIGGFYLTVMQALPLIHQDKGFVPSLQLSATLPKWWLAKLATLLLITLPFTLLIGIGGALVMGIPATATLGVAVVTGSVFAITGLAAAIATMDPTADEESSSKPAVMLAGAVLAALLFTTVPFALYWSTWDAPARLIVVGGALVFWAWVLAGSVFASLHHLRRLGS